MMIIFNTILYMRPQRKLWQSCCFITAVCFLSACSNKDDESENSLGDLRDRLKNDSSYSSLWYEHAKNVFIEGAENSTDGKRPSVNKTGIERLADIINSPEELLAQQAPPSRASKLPSQQSNEAKLERLHQQELMLHAHLYTLCATCFEQELQHSELLASLEKLSQDFPNLHLGKLRAYYANNDEKLLAYSIKSDKQRIYVAFNFSFDLQEVPLPFGFMSSTKVSLWQSDSENITSFVTQSPLMIGPFTAVIIIV
ncbi:hypothetical protein ISG33_08030 [Glaciecola sp. MH2013]|uniref:hypothetical protein n=1 Tax=Glaciecola sp. MH2013 TaxID=2785524 RepID=UPI00189EF414|nr:hypothetical protein [Glaciecola sp. MH2013]MBF7073341.1 hypothetical protein [Glaciecola sp. MH2013]